MIDLIELTTLVPNIVIFAVAYNIRVGGWGRKVTE